MIRRRRALLHDPLRHVSDAEVERAIRSVPTHYAGWSADQWSGAGAGYGSGSHTLAYGSNVGAGHLLIAAISASVAGCTWTVTDSQGNTWRQAGGYATNSSGACPTSIWWAVAGSSAADSVTITPSTATYVSLAIHEYTPPTGTIGVDQYITNNGTSQNPSTGTCPVTAAGELIFAVFGQSTGNESSCSVASPFTARVNVLSAGENMGTADDTSADSSGDTATWTVSGVTPAWAAIAASFGVNLPATPRRILVSLPPLPAPFLD